MTQADKRVPVADQAAPKTSRRADPAAPQATTGSPPLPHERDEGTGMTGGVPSRRVQQGHKDLQRGVQDTSRGPEADQAYKQLKK